MLIMSSSGQKQSPSTQKSMKTYRAGAYRRNYDSPTSDKTQRKRRNLHNFYWESFPCCHIHDESVGSYTKHYVDKLNVDFSLHNRGLLDILNDPWYTDTLEKSWDKNHPLHLPRCYLTCGDNGKREVRKIIE